MFQGSMAQWIRRLPTEQEILGSSPGRVKYFSGKKLFKNIYILSEFLLSRFLIDNDLERFEKDLRGR